MLLTNRNTLRGSWVFLWAVLAAPTLQGCNVFHSSEIEAEDASPAGSGGVGGSGEADAGDNPSDGSADSAGSATEDAPAGEGAFLADYCADPSIPTKGSNDNVFSLGNTSALVDNVNDLSGCGISRELRGSDGFLGVAMNAGDKWHFHVHAGAEQDLAIYLLPTCDARTCTKAVDRCPKGQDEHMTVFAPTAGMYYLGIDGLDGAPVGVTTTLVINPKCGDKNKVHGEGCDDGNLDDGDGCDSRCRNEIKNGGDEAEPNGELFAANVVRIPTDNGLGISTLKGQIGGPCDTDVFSVRVPSGGTLSAALRTEVAMPCPEGTPPVTMRILDAQGAVLATSVMGGDAGDTGACPVATLPGPAGAAGEYYVSFATENSSASFRYQLEVQVR